MGHVAHSRCCRDSAADDCNELDILLIEHRHARLIDQYVIDASSLDARRELTDRPSLGNCRVRMAFTLRDYRATFIAAMSTIISTHSEILIRGQIKTSFSQGDIKFDVEKPRRCVKTS
jgi:hypothetical protein